MSENQLADKGRRIDLRKLGTFALEKLPIKSSLRDVLLSERDEIQADEFIHKLFVWLKLCSHLQNNYCINWHWSQRPNDALMVGQPLLKDAIWHIQPTNTFCALCPSYYGKS